MNLLIAVLFVIFVFLIGIMPFRMVYLLSDLFYLLLNKLIFYRRKVIIDNLKQTFPEMPQEKLKLLLADFYKNLADLMVEGLKGFTMTKKQIVKRHFLINPEVLKPYYDEGRSIIGVTGHYNNWEWGTMSSSLQCDYKIIGFYKPLSNKYIDKFLRWSRSRCGTTLASIGFTAKTFEEYKDIKTVYLMAADQNTSSPEKAYWVNFLGRETAFLHGPEKYIRNYDYVLMYVNVQRVKRGYYTLELSVLTDNPKELAEGEITARYAKKLESVILKQPENWLWSHRRWKYNRE